MPLRAHYKPVRESEEEALLGTLYLIPTKSKGLRIGPTGIKYGVPLIA